MSVTTPHETDTRVPSVYLRNFLIGVLRLRWDPVWNVQVVLFLIGGLIEWVLISELLANAGKVTKGNVSMALPAACVAFAVMHQFLILRNIEVDRDVARNTSPFLRAIVRLLAIMVSVFLLATITGEVPYLLSLLLFKFGPAGYWAHTFDFLNIFGEYTSWTNVTFDRLREGFPLYCKGLFFSASFGLACMVLFWDMLEVLFVGGFSQKYPAWQRLPVLAVFFVSDGLSILIWLKLLSILQVIGAIPFDAFAAGIFSSEDGKIITSDRDWILAVTILYGLAIMPRVLINTFSNRDALEIHNSIV